MTLMLTIQTNINDVSMMQCWKGGLDEMETSMIGISACPSQYKYEIACQRDLDSMIVWLRL